MSNDFIMQLKNALTHWPAWYFYAAQDIKNKYSRSVFGPLWITISIAVTIFAMGPLYSVLFKVSGDNYYIHLATGLVFWSFIAGTLAESCVAFIANESFIKQTKLPLFIYIARVIMRNSIILLHNLLVVALIVLYQGSLSIKMFYFIPNFILLVPILFFSSYVLATVCARFRDVAPLVSNVLQLFMFLTPIFWTVSAVTERSKYILFNPFNYLISSLRNPIMGINDLSIYPILLGMLLIFVILSYIFHVLYSKKVVYWL